MITTRSLSRHESTAQKLALGMSIIALVALGALFVNTRPAYAAAGRDFEMRYQTSSTATATVAYLVRGGLTTCNPALNCNGGLVEPKVTTYYGYSPNDSYGYGLGQINVDAGDPDTGFRGTIAFAFSNLPHGVTAQAPMTTTISDTAVLYSDWGFPVFGTSSTLQLHADASAALGTTNVTMTATSGTLSHSLTIPIQVVEALPSLALYPTLIDSTTTVSGGQSFQLTVKLNYPVPTGQSDSIHLASDHPTIAPVLATVTIAAGGQSLILTIKTTKPKKITLVNFTATYLGQSVPGSVQVNNF